MSTNGDSYWAVIFSSRHSGKETGSYEEVADRMIELARRQPGFLDVESSRSDDGSGITVSYWESPEAIAAWKRQAEHLEAQRRGKATWYQDYRVRVAEVVRDYSFSSQPATSPNP